MTKQTNIPFREIGKVLLIVLVLALVVVFTSRMGNVQEEGQTQFVTEAVRSAALTCYAVEGAYPESLQYLREQYGLAYDEDRYAVTYEAFASNMLPDIYVTERK